MACLLGRVSLLALLALYQNVLDGLEFQLLLLHVIVVLQLDALF